MNNREIRLGIVGARGVLGQAIIDALNKGDVEVAEVLLFGRQDSKERLTVCGEKHPVRMLHGDADNFRGLTHVVFCTPPEVVRTNAPIARRQAITVIDCSGALRSNNMDAHVPTRTEIEERRVTHNGVLVPPRLSFAADTAHDVVRMLDCERAAA